MARSIPLCLAVAGVTRLSGPISYPNLRWLLPGAAESKVIGYDR